MQRQWQTSRRASQLTGAALTSLGWGFHPGSLTVDQRSRPRDAAQADQPIPIRKFYEYKLTGCLQYKQPLTSVPQLFSATQLQVFGFPRSDVDDTALQHARFYFSTG